MADAKLWEQDPFKAMAEHCRTIDECDFCEWNNSCKPLRLNAFLRMPVDWSDTLEQYNREVEDEANYLHRHPEEVQKSIAQITKSMTYVMSELNEVCENNRDCRRCPFNDCTVRLDSPALIETNLGINTLYKNVVNLSGYFTSTKDIMELYRDDLRQFRRSLRTASLYAKQIHKFVQEFCRSHSENSDCEYCVLGVNVDTCPAWDTRSWQGYISIIDTAYNSIEDKEDEVNDK